MNQARQVVLSWVDAFNRRDADAAAALYHQDATNLQVPLGEPVVGRMAIHAGLAEFFRAFPDNYTKVETLLTEGDWAALEWSGGGTWRGEFAGRTGTGQQFALRGSGFFHVVGGLIRFQRGYWDRVTWFDQLGLPATSKSPI